MTDPIGAADFERLALEELATAEDLARLHRWRAAFGHAGLSVEMALKARIIRAYRLNRWPDAPSPYHVHDLLKLARHAGVDMILLDEARRCTPLGVAWAVAKDWSIGIRYDPRPFPPRRGADMVEAVGEKGLLRWLLTP